MLRKPVRSKQTGFTLIEIAIVVVIIGLLLGGVLKGQEMIRNARAHNVADQGNAVKAAILGFQDRYRAVPGDYAKADANIPGVTTDHNGNGDSRVGNDPEDGNNTTRENEIAYVWEHLSKSGFISGDFSGDETNLNDTDWTCGSGACLTNAYNGHLMFLYDNEQFNPVGTYTTGPKNNQITTGALIPVEIIAEIDRKVDDGDPATGSFRIGHRFLTTAAGNSTECALSSETNGTAVDTWNIAGQQTDCGGVYMF
ncbi:MAG: prepilin-type N-terminal cleavage/methylation domain-containing protein [Magnetococcales bacterium]|nr:prepilin-type N-terminal cleavage/methylation domain-containing protein [Magnetococcales bacterium]